MWPFKTRWGLPSVCHAAAVPSTVRVQLAAPAVSQIEGVEIVQHGQQVCNTRRTVAPAFARRYGGSQDLRVPAPWRGDLGEDGVAPLRAPEGRALHMFLPTNSVSDFIRSRHPDVFCAACIAKRSNIPEKTVREALQVVALRLGFGFGLRTCRGCGRTVVVVKVEAIPPHHEESLPRTVDDGPGGIPHFVCRLCGHLITAIADTSISDAGVAHGLCIDGRSVDPLTPDERSRLIRICWHHEVALCGICKRRFRPSEMSADLFNGRYNLCPFCRVGLAPSIRHHIAGCAVILHADAKWQAEVRETLERASATRKASGQLRDTSELTRIESEVLQSKVREAAEAARRAQEEAERVKRETPGGK